MSINFPAQSNATRIHLLWHEQHASAILIADVCCPYHTIKIILKWNHLGKNYDYFICCYNYTYICRSVKRAASHFQKVLLESFSCVFSAASFYYNGNPLLWMTPHMVTTVQQLKYKEVPSIWSVSLIPEFVF